MEKENLAGQPAPRELLVNIPRLVSAYYLYHPDPADPNQQVAFGTSGHRGSSFESSFNEDHVLAISQALCEYRQQQGINGPLFIGKDTHALSEPAQMTAIEVFAANGVEVRYQAGMGYTPTPVISHAILTYNRGLQAGWRTGWSSPLRITRRKMAGTSTTRPAAARPVLRSPTWCRGAPTKSCLPPG